MKVYIVGPVASGKSTLARQLSARTGEPHIPLDDIAHAPASTGLGNERRSETQRDALFAQVLAGEGWIIEDTGRACFEAGLEQAQQVVLLAPPFPLRCFRILTRWIRQRRGKEPCSYRPTLGMLGSMFRWTWGFDSGADGTRARAQRQGTRLVKLRRKREIEGFLARYDGKR